MDDFAARLGEFQGIVQRAFDDHLGYIVLKAGKQTGVYMETVFAEYPPSPAGRPLAPRHFRERIKDGQPTGDWYFSKFVSDKQQNWFFHSLAEGSLDLPYTRSGLLGRSFTSDAHLEGGSLIIEVGSAVEYARYVIGVDQSWYHWETGWVNVDENLLARQEEFISYFLDRFFDLYQVYIETGTL